MRQVVRDFVAFCVEHLDLQEPVYDFGARSVPGGGSADMRGYFPDMEFVGADLEEGPGVDVVLDLHHIDVPTASVGTVLILDTLEHVEYPRQAIDEVWRILKPNGVLIVTTVLNFHIHSEPDYWRFTPDGMRSLLKDFPAGFVVSSGHSKFPSAVMGVGLMEDRPADVSKGYARAWKEEERK